MDSNYEQTPVNGTIHTIQQDNVNPNLLFAGSEFGFYFSIDGGNEWIEFKSGYLQQQFVT